MADTAKVGQHDQAPGEPLTTKSRVLEAGASAVQDFTPVKQICAHLNAYHTYATDPTRCVEANHYCTHLTEGTPAQQPSLTHLQSATHRH